MSLEYLKRRFSGKESPFKNSKVEDELDKLYDNYLSCLLDNDSFILFGFDTNITVRFDEPYSASCMYAIHTFLELAECGFDVLKYNKEEIHKLHEELSSLGLLQEPKHTDKLEGTIKEFIDAYNLKSLKYMNNIKRLDNKRNYILSKIDALKRYINETHEETISQDEYMKVIHKHLDDIEKGAIQCYEKNKELLP